MKKVLIADDEMLVRIGLKNMIDWHANGYNVVGEVHNYARAISVFEETDPDILICDIRMGATNGIELAKALKDKKPSINVIMLTNYDDFNYARDAFRIGANEYILKSDLTAQLLLETLNSHSKYVDTVNQNFKESASTFTDNLSMILNSVLQNSLSSTIFNDELLEMYQNKEFLFCVVQYFYQADSELQMTGSLSEYHHSIQNILNEALQNLSIQFSSIIVENKQYILMNLGASNSDNNKAMILILSAIESFKNSIRQVLDVEILVGVSSITSSPRFLGALYQEALIALEYSFFTISGIYDFYSVEGSTNRMDLIRNKNEIKMPKINILRRIIQEGSEEQLIQYINETLDQFKSIGTLDDLQHMFADFMSYVKIIADERDTLSAPVFSESKLNYKNFSYLCCMEVLKQFVTDLYLELLKPMELPSQNGYSFIISKSLEFIKNNYDRNLTLGDLADHVEISKCYLSMLFKQEVGINFSNYLSTYRVEQSKKLLLESNYKVYEVATMVGFDNPYYFSKVFKDVTGKSCLKFKNAQA